MKTYKVRTWQVWEVYTLIDALCESDAIAGVQDGKGDMIFSDFSRMLDGAEIISDNSPKG